MGFFLFVQKGRCMVSLYLWLAILFAIDDTTGKGGYDFN